MCDGVDEMRLAETDAAVQEDWIEPLPRSGAHRLCSLERDFVRRADHEGVERVVRHQLADLRRTHRRRRYRLCDGLWQSPFGRRFRRDDYAHDTGCAGQLRNGIANRWQEVSRDPRLIEATRNFEPDFPFAVETTDRFDPGREVSFSHMLPQQWQRRRPECLHARPPLEQMVGPSDRSGCMVNLHTWGQLPNPPPPRRFSPCSTTSCTLTMRRFILPPTGKRRSEHPTNFIA